MGKLIYVNGSIGIQTRYFVPKDLGCGYTVAPEGAEIVEANDEVNGVKCLLIDDAHPQSLFNEYYSKDGLAADCIAASYLKASYLDCINEYRKRIEETCEVVKSVSDWDDNKKALVYKMAYVNILTALDAFICYVILKRSTSNEQLFTSVMFELATKTKTDKWEKLIEAGKDGEWEQEAIIYVLETSFLNTKKIDKAIKQVKLEKLEYDRESMDYFFKKRHLIVHRSGRERDDNEFIVTYQLLADLINECHTLVGAIFDSLCITLDREMKAKPEEPDLEEVFPGGIVRMPFKLSDLERLLQSNAPTTEFEPIRMPVLNV